MLALSFFNDEFLTAFDPFRALDEWSIRGGNRPSKLSAVDLNGDGSLDLLTFSAAFDVLNDAIIWEPEEPFGLTTAGDINGDGTPEIVSATTSGGEEGSLILYARSEAGLPYNRSTHPIRTTKVFDLEITDTDGDGRGEVLVVARDSDTGAIHLQRFGSDVELINSFPVLEGTEGLKQRRAILFSGGAEPRHILIATNYFSAFDTQTGGKIWQSPGFQGDVTRNSFHHVEVDGEIRLAFGTNVAMYVTR